MLKKILSSLGILLFIFHSNYLFSQPGILWEGMIEGGSGTNAFLELNDYNYLFFETPTFNSKIVIIVQKRNFSDGTIIWNDTLTGDGNNELIKLIKLSDDNIVLAATVDSSGDLIHGFNGKRDIWLCKLNSQTGDTIWTNTLGNFGENIPVDIMETKDQNILLIGKSDTIGTLDFFGTGLQLNDFFIARINAATGNVMWESTYGGFGNDLPGKVIETFDSNFVVLGLVDSSGNDVHGYHLGYASSERTTDLWMLKLNGSTGDTLWTKVLGGTETDGNTQDFIGISFLAFLEEADDSNFVITTISGSGDGDVKGAHGGTDIWIVKVNASNGDTIWSRTAGGSADDVLQDAKIILDNNIVLVGYTYSSDGDVHGFHGGGSFTDIWVVKMDASAGDTIWTKVLGGSGADFAQVIYEHSIQEFIVAGSTTSPDGDISNYHSGLNNGGDPNKDFWLIKLDSLGNLVWETALGGNNDEEFYRIEFLCDGGYLLSGDSYTSDGTGDVTLISPCNGITSPPCENLWCIKLDSIGNKIWDRLFSSSGHDENFSAYLTHDQYLFEGAAANNLIAGDKTVSGSGAWIIKIGLEAGIGGDTLSCLGDTISFMDASINVTDWFWEFGDGNTSMEQNPRHLYDSSGEYTLKLIVPEMECSYDTAIRMINIALGTKLPLVPFVSQCSEDSIFIGEEPLSGSYSYKWYPTTGLSDTAISNPYISIQSDSIYNEWYILSVIDSLGCIGRDSIHVIISPLPKVDAGNDTSILKETSIVLNGTIIGTDTFYWEPTYGLNSFLTLTPTFSFDSTTQYYLIAISDSGCVAIDSVLIKVFDEGIINMPQIFTPNGDGINDDFMIYPIGIEVLNSFAVYSRWGELLFETKDITKGWDGTFLDIPQENGLYIYMVNAVGKDGKEISIEGSVFLLK